MKNTVITAFTAIHSHGEFSELLSVYAFIHVCAQTPLINFKFENGSAHHLTSTGLFVDIVVIEVCLLMSEMYCKQFVHTNSPFRGVQMIERPARTKRTKMCFLM